MMIIKIRARVLHINKSISIFQRSSWEDAGFFSIKGVLHPKFQILFFNMKIFL